MGEVKLSESAQSLKRGQYQHYKGNKYQLLSVAIDSETFEELVIYKANYGKHLIWARPLKMFLEEVEYNGTKQPRFKYLGSV